MSFESHGVRNICCVAAFVLVATSMRSVMKRIAWVALGCLALGACASPTQTVGTAGGVVAGAAVGGPVGAVATAPGTPLGGARYRCRYRDRYGYVHYHWCRA